MPGRKGRLQFVEVANAKGREYIYYRRDGRRQALAGPEGSKAFLADYNRIHSEFEHGLISAAGHTVRAAIEEYKGSADYLELSEESRRHYDLYLGELTDRAGNVLLRDITADWVDKLRDKLARKSDPHRWNRTRSLMRMVTAAYVRRHPDAIDADPWDDSKRLKVGKSTQNRPWPELRPRRRNSGCQPGVQDAHRMSPAVHATHLRYLCMAIRCL